MHPSLPVMLFGCAFAALTASAQFTVKNYDTPSYVQFSAARFEVTEGETNAVITVVRSGDYRKTAAVDYATVEGTAAANVDFQPAGGTIVFSSGQSVRTITIPILREEPCAQAKTFQVQLQQPAANTVLLSESAEVEIKAQPPALEIEFSEGKLLVTWPDVGLPFRLEAQVDGSWSAVAPEPITADGFLTVTVTPDQPVALFRLRLEAAGE